MSDDEYNSDGTVESAGDVYGMRRRSAITFKKPVLSGSGKDGIPLSTGIMASAAAAALVGGGSGAGKGRGRVVPKEEDDLLGMADDDRDDDDDDDYLDDEDEVPVPLADKRMRGGDPMDGDDEDDLVGEEDHHLAGEDPLEFNISQPIHPTPVWQQPIMAMGTATAAPIETAKKSRGRKTMTEEEVRAKVEQKLANLPELDNLDAYLKKFDHELARSYVQEYHPECLFHCNEEVKAMTAIVRDSNGMVVDELHRTCPVLTKYERARVLGQRAKQIEMGAVPFVDVPESIIDPYLIAEMELKQRQLPAIIRRILPEGNQEYWHVRDLEIL